MAKPGPAIGGAFHTCPRLHQRPLLQRHAAFPAGITVNSGFGLDQVKEIGPSTGSLLLRPNGKRPFPESKPLKNPGGGKRDDIVEGWPSLKDGMFPVQDPTDAEMPASGCVSLPLNRTSRLEGPQLKRRSTTPMLGINGPPWTCW
jgi:hypothetical protein